MPFFDDDIREALQKGVREEPGQARADAMRRNNDVTRLGLALGFIAIVSVIVLTGVAIALSGFPSLAELVA